MPDHLLPDHLSERLAAELDQAREACRQLSENWREALARAQKAEAGLASLKERLQARLEDERSQKGEMHAWRATAFRDALDDLPARPCRENSFQEDVAEVEGEADAENCKRCGRSNTVWSASSPLWNAVIRGGSINGAEKYGDLVCATCFMQLAEDQGVATRFRVTAEVVNVELETTTPSGRVWDEDRFQWVEAEARGEDWPDLWIVLPGGEEIEAELVASRHDDLELDEGDRIRRYIPDPQDHAAGGSEETLLRRIESEARADSLTYAIKSEQGDAEYNRGASFAFTAVAANIAAHLAAQPEPDPSGVQGGDLAGRRERAVDQLLDIAKVAHDDVMREELEGLASRLSLPPAEEKIDRCPTCGSRNPWFTDCKDKAQAEAETGRTFPSEPGDCGDPWHNRAKQPQPNSSASRGETDA